MSAVNTIAAQIDAAFNYRGHVTVSLADGRVIEGFLYNRELSPLKGEGYIEIIPKDTDERLRFAASLVSGVTLSGKDFAVPFVPTKKD